MLYHYCKGCHKFKPSNEIALMFYVRGGERASRYAPGVKQINLCLECDEVGKFICVSCETVHLHEADCSFKSPASPIQQQEAA